MKTSSIVCLVLAGLLVILNHAANYWLGYSESSQAGLASDPILGLLMECSIFGYLLFLVIISVFRKPRGRWPLYSLIVFWPLVVLIEFSIGRPGPLIVHGLRDRVMHDYSLDDLRQFARDVNQGISFKGNPPFGKWINHGDTSELTESEKIVYTRLRQKYPFTHWMAGPQGRAGPSIASPEDGVVVFEWGGALPGHWGCSISTKGANNEDGSDVPDTTILHVSDDIYFFYGD
jgi:hypothetical protein